MKKRNFIFFVNEIGNILLFNTGTEWRPPYLDELSDNLEKIKQDITKKMQWIGLVPLNKEEPVLVGSGQGKLSTMSNHISEFDLYEVLVKGSHFPLAGNYEYVNPTDITTWHVSEVVQNMFMIYEHKSSLLANC